MIKLRHKKLIIIIAVICFLIAVFFPQIKYLITAFQWAYVFTKSHGPEANEVIYISDKEYSLKQITNSIDKIQHIHNLEKRDSKRREPTRYITYDTAIFYSLPRTDYYGFGIGILRTTKKEYMDDSRYRILILSNIEPCTLCTDTLSTLDSSNIKYTLE